VDESLGHLELAKALGVVCSMAAENVCGDEGIGLHISLQYLTTARSVGACNVLYPSRTRCALLPVVVPVHTQQPKRRKAYSSTRIGPCKPAGCKFRRLSSGS